MKEHVILLITNRQEEDIIVRHIMSKCNITEEFNVWSYSASLMEIYNWIYDVDGKEVEKCQFINVFRKQEKSVKYKVLCQQNFTEIILSYDLSDLDYDDDKEKIYKLLKYFNNIRKNGKLFINYPTIEAFYHTEEFHKGDFENREIGEKDISVDSYRMIVGGEIGFPDWNMYNEDIIYELMKRNLKKCYNIISKQCWPNREQEDYRSIIDFAIIFKKQIKHFHNNEKMPILCTSLCIPLEILGVKKRVLLELFKE